MNKKNVTIKGLVIIFLAATYGTFDSLKFLMQVSFLSEFDRTTVEVPDWIWGLIEFSYWYDWLVVLVLLILVFYRWEIEEGITKLKEKYNGIH